MIEKLKVLIVKIFTPQFIRFILTAILNTLFGLFINYLFLYIFEHLLKLNHAYIVSNFLATIVSILFNFKTYGILVFKNKKNRLFFRFLLVTTFTYLLNIGGIALLQHLGSRNNYLNLTLMAIPVGLLNYTLNKHFVYTNKAKGWHWLCLCAVLASELAIFLILKY
ncbi:MAG: GtrA family protein [Bacteroidales bacterium]|nr:GtrA family protein [Bacteroidales bacterium]